MSSLAEYKSGVGSFFDGDYKVVSTKSIPDAADIAFGKEGKQAELAMLFIDINESTKIMASVRRVTAAKIYKSFLWGVSKIAKDNGGEVRSFNGDGVLVAFIGDRKCNNAVKAAMQMKYFCETVLKPQADTYLKDKESLDGTLFDYGIGIDTGTILVVKGGFKGSNNNDLVWVGNATNIAVKLSSFGSDPYNIWISKDVYSSLNDDRKNADGVAMWKAMNWGEKRVYKTLYKWVIK